MRGLMAAKAPLDTFDHQIADHFPGDTAGRRHPRDDLSIAGVERKGDTNALTAPAGDFKTIGRPLGPSGISPF